MYLKNRVAVDLAKAQRMCCMFLKRIQGNIWPFSLSRRSIYRQTAEAIKVAVTVA